MNNDRLNLLKEYAKANIAPLLVENIPSNIFDNSVILKADIDKSELNGHYEDGEFCPPTWYKDVEEKAKNGRQILVIDKLNEISMEEQNKFIELLKYRKIGVFKLPKNCVIIITCSELKNNKISEEIFSLVAYI